MQIPVFSTPEAAAMAGFPADHCRVLAASIHGETAFVVLDTGAAGYPYLYAGTAERVENGWVDAVSSNGPSAGWTRTGQERDCGVAYIYDEAPNGADRVRAALGSDLKEAPVQHGIYLVTWWGVSAHDSRTPVSVAFHVGGDWIPARG